jgi:hypothetical protein
MADTQAVQATGKGTTKHLCGVPAQYCCGSTSITSKSIQGNPKLHNSSQEAMRCHGRYLINVLGYQKMGAREFSPPDGGPIRVLTKSSRFGARMRPGKGGRNMPTKQRAGVVISC